jgi:D-alanyl-D-alanine carboxypeptidase
MSANGQLTPAELTTVQGPIQLAPGTARAWAAMLAAAADAGFTLWIATPAGGYRSLAVQRDMHARPWAYNLANNGVTLAPVGASTHGYGTRIDMMPTWGKAFDWILTNAARFGFTREFGAADPNHFTHTTTITAGTGEEITPLPVWKDDTMFRLVAEATTDRIWIIGASGKRAQIATPTHLQLLRRLFASTNADDKMLLAEIDICAAYLKAVDATDTLTITPPDVDEQAIINGILAALPTNPEFDTAALAAAVDTALADNFAAIPTPGQIADERDARERKRLGL